MFSYINFFLRCSFRMKYMKIQFCEKEGDEHVFLIEKLTYTHTHRKKIIGDFILYYTATHCLYCKTYYKNFIKEDSQSENHLVEYLKWESLVQLLLKYYLMIAHSFTIKCYSLMHRKVQTKFISWNENTVISLIACGNYFHNNNNKSNKNTNIAT